MDNKIVDRIAIIIRHFKLNNNSFETRLGLSTNYIGPMIKRGGNVGSHIIQKIIQEFPTVNVRWLITGEGNIEIDQADDTMNINKFIEQLVEQKVDNKLNSHVTQEMIKMIVAGMIDEEISKVSDKKIK